MPGWLLWSQGVCLEWSLVLTQLQSAETDKYFCLTADDCSVLAGRVFLLALPYRKGHSGPVLTSGSSRADRELGVLMGAGRKLVFPLLSPCEDRFF